MSASETSDEAVDAFTKARARLAWGHAGETVVEDLVRAGVPSEEAREYVRDKLQREDRGTRRGGVGGLVVSLVIGGFGALTTVYFLPFIPIGSGNLIAQLDAVGFPLCNWRVAPQFVVWLGPGLLAVGFFAALHALASIVFGGRRDRSDHT